MTTGKSKRRQFTEEFKADAVQLVIQGSRPIAQVAPAPVDAVRMARLEAENRRLAQENAFLKKAAAFFAKEQA